MAVAEDYLTKEQVNCLEGIEKCDNFLKKVCEYANEVVPELVARTFKRFNSQLVDGGCDESPDFHLVIFYANAKQGFILRLVAIQERENAVLMA